MKKLIYVFLFYFLIISDSYSQLPQEYPFKTLLDEQNNLLVTGYDGNNDFFVRKFSANSPNFLWTNFYANPGYDRGMDLIEYYDNSTFTQYVYATGYVYNQLDWE